VANEVQIGLIEYGNHNQIPAPKFTYSNWGETDAPIPPNPWYFPRWFKRMKFSFEKELRATTYVNVKLEPYDKGINVVLGANGVRSLIDAVYLHPNAPTGFQDRVLSVLQKHGFDEIPVKPSVLM
jgi:hypothetical protein